MIVVHVSAVMGWTLDYTEWHLDIPRLARLNAYWQMSPPPVVLLSRIAAFLGVRSSSPTPSSPAPSAINGSDVAELQESLPQGPMPTFMSPDEYRRRKEASEQ